MTITQEVSMKTPDENFEWQRARALEQDYARQIEADDEKAAFDKFLVENEPDTGWSDFDAARGEYLAHRSSGSGS
jgi:hypothetical protein